MLRQERGYVLEDNGKVHDRVSTQRRRAHVPLFIVVMMREGCQMTKFLFVIPTQERNINEKLVCIINVPPVVVYPHMESALPCELCPDLEEELGKG